MKMIEKKKCKSFDAFKRIDNEIDVLEELAGIDHPGILSLVEVLHGRDNLYMLTEKVNEVWIWRRGGLKRI